MKKKNKSADHSALFLMAKKNEDPTPNVELPGDFLELSSRAIGQAVEMQKASIATVIGLNACVMDVYKNAFWFLDTAAQSFAFCMELQMQWLAMMVPHLDPGAETASQVAAPSSSTGKQIRHTADALEHSMDIAIGAGYAASKSSSGPQPGRQALAKAV